MARVSNVGPSLSGKRVHETGRCGVLQTTLEGLKGPVDRLARAPILALDTETTGLDPLADKVLLLALSDGLETLVVDVRNLPRDGLRQALAPVLAGGPVKVMHNAKFDLRMLASLGLDAFPVADTWLTQLVLDGGRRDESASLASLTQRYLGMPLSKDAQKSFVGMSTGSFSPAQVEYAARDVLATWNVFLAQTSLLPGQGAHKVARLESLAVRAVAAMEHTGLAVDAAAWRAVVAQAQQDRDVARAELDRLFRPVCNVDLLGSVDLQYERESDVLAALGRLGVDVAGLSNAALTASGHPAALALVRHREAGKLVGTYGEGFLQHLHPATGRIHAQFRQIGASTGRMSCEKPNLQNIPKDSTFRSAVRAPPGRTLITADYAACELRILAHMAQDPVFLAAFSAGEDVHSRVAGQVFGVTVSKKENPHLRERAKAVSFGLIYGMGAAGLAAATGQSLPDAEALFARYFAQFPRIDALLTGLESDARRAGFAQTVMGRRMYLPPDAFERGGSGTRLARNMPIQGASADITKLALAFIHTRLQGTNAGLVNCVHDEFLVECDAGDAPMVAGVVKQEMERAMAAVVPGVTPLADVHVGDTWLKG